VKGSLRRPRTSGGTWSYRLDLGVGSDGRRQQTQVSGFSTRRTAQAALNEALAEHQHGTFVAPSKQTVVEFVETWLDAVKPELAESAWTNYRLLLRAYVLPRVGQVRLVDLTPQRIQAMYAELLERGKRDGSPLAPRSVLQVHKTLHRALQDAVRWRLVSRNPADSARGPRFEEKEMTAWSLEDAQKFLAATGADRLAALWLVALNTGMRRGELAGLRWRDVDLDAGSLAITQQRTTADYRVVVAEPKARSRRVITMDSSVVEALRAHRRHQLGERLAVGPGWADSGYVFVDELGRPYHPQRLREMLDRACRSAGVPLIRLHDLRHTMATTALRAGIHPKIVQERLGHSTIALTLDTYSHVTPTLQRAAAEKLGELFSG
jgi:integrase